MPSEVQTTRATYLSVNTQISGDASRSVCVWFRASALNADNIIFDIGSTRTGGAGGCNEHFALSVMDTNHVTVYGMCNPYDVVNINAGGNTLYDGFFHQVCVTYNNINSQLCIYLDLLSPTCLTRTNPAYNTGLGDVRIGWWSDENRPFKATGGGKIKLLSLFNIAVNQSCVSYQYQINSAG